MSLSGKSKSSTSTEHQTSVISIAESTRCSRLFLAVKVVIVVIPIGIVATLLLSMRTSRRDTRELNVAPTFSPTQSKDMEELFDSRLSTATPSEAPQDEDTSLQHDSDDSTQVSCERYTYCLGHRIANGVVLYPGQAICSEGGSGQRFMMGVTEDSGTLLWRDCATNETVVYFDGAGGSSEGMYFMMKDDASWNVFRTLDTKVNYEGQYTLPRDTDELLWVEESVHSDIQNFRHCLLKPVMDCPYLHMRRSGVIVLNYIDFAGRGHEENIRHAYPVLDTPVD